MTDDLSTFVLERDFAAPPALVWRAWTEPDLFARWYGPGVETHIVGFEARAGGGWRLEMHMPGGVGHQSAEITAFEPPHRLDMIMCTCDAEWAVAANPAMPDWPRRLLTEVTLSAIDTGTRQRLVWTPHQAEPREIAFFAGAMENLGMGWGMGFDELARILDEIADG